MSLLRRQSQSQSGIPARPNPCAFLGLQYLLPKRESAWFRPLKIRLPAECFLPHTRIHRPPPFPLIRIQDKFFLVLRLVLASLRSISEYRILLRIYEL